MFVMPTVVKLQPCSQAGVVSAASWDHLFFEVNNKPANNECLQVREPFRADAATGFFPFEAYVCPVLRMEDSKWLK